MTTDLTYAMIMYHEDLDGAAAAACVLEYLDRRVQPTSAVLVPVNYGDALPEDLSEYAELFAVDFCPPEEDLERWDAQGVDIAVFDHHVTREETTRRFGYYAASQSAVGIAWRQLLGERLGEDEDAMPYGVRCVEDRDLWRWGVTGSKLYTAALASYGFDPRTLREILFDPERDLEVVNVGERIVAVMQNQIAQAAQRVHTLELAEVEFNAVNASWPISELAEALYTQDPTRPAVVYSINEGAKTVRLSLRRHATCDVDVSEVAKHYGGGGHVAAAGCRLPIEKFVALLV